MENKISSKIITLKEISNRMGLSPQSAKKWIQTFTDISFPIQKNRKRFFTPGEEKKIMDEWGK
jgi:hypothetical protein